MMFHGVWKIFQHWKLSNYKSDINETWSRCIPPQHLSFTKKWRWESKAGRGCTRKTIKKCYEINKFPTLTLPKTSLQNAIKAGIFLLSSIIIWLYCWSKSRGGPNPPRYGGCFLLGHLYHLYWAHFIFSCSNIFIYIYIYIYIYR